MVCAAALYTCDETLEARGAVPGLGNGLPEGYLEVISVLSASMDVRVEYRKVARSNRVARCNYRSAMFKVGLLFRRA